MAGTDAESLEALTETDVAYRLGVSASTLRMWRQKGRGPRFVKYGRTLRYMREDVERFVQERLEDGAARPESSE
jgi:excisionase family DNA binding protein